MATIKSEYEFGNKDGCTRTLGSFHQCSSWLDIPYYFFLFFLFPIEATLKDASMDSIDGSSSASAF